VGNLNLRFDEGRVGRAQASPSLLLYHRGSVDLSHCKTHTRLTPSSPGAECQPIPPGFQLGGEIFLKSREPTGAGSAVPPWFHIVSSNVSN
jgi:hypothetical protein